MYHKIQLQIQLPIQIENPNCKSELHNEVYRYTTYHYTCGLVVTLITRRRSLTFLSQFIRTNLSNLVLSRSSLY